MGDCIYFLRDKNLTYKKQEHIISAGLGGRQTLPKGFVSDQANELFSKNELQYMRYSPLLTERVRYGPGKRGSMNINSINNPDVLALQPYSEEYNDKSICLLGFLFCNQAYVLPQAVVVFDEELNGFEKIYLRSTYKASGNISEMEFFNRLRKFLMSEQINYRNVVLPYETKEKFVCIGCYKKSWYICSSIPNFDIGEWAKQIVNKEALKIISNHVLGLNLSTLKFKYSREIPLDNLIPVFIHAKNCFNVLASFRGTEFVRQKIFDFFRQSIISNNGWDKILKLTKEIKKEVLYWVKSRVRNHEHVVVIYTHSHKIMAFSLLYGVSYAAFLMAEEYFGESFSCAMICDFESSKEKCYDSIL